MTTGRLFALRRGALAYVDMVESLRALTSSILEAWVRCLEVSCQVGWFKCELREERGYR